MNQQEEISLTAFQKAARALCLWLLADGEKERKAFLRYGKGDTGFYFLKNFSNGYAAAGLLRKITFGAGNRDCPASCLRKRDK